MTESTLEEPSDRTVSAPWPSPIRAVGSLIECATDLNLAELKQSATSDTTAATWDVQALARLAITIGAARRVAAELLRLVLYLAAIVIVLVVIAGGVLAFVGILRLLINPTAIPHRVVQVV